MNYLMNILLISIIATSCGSNKKNNTDAMPLGDNSKNSLDWQGVYSSKVPNEDKSAMQLTIHLLDDSNYILSRTVQEDATNKTFREKGKFAWNKLGSQITLTPDSKSITHVYSVGENVLIPLDENGNRKSQEYFIFKQDTELKEKYWKIVELSGNRVVVKHEKSREPHIVFKSHENRFNGNTGCNTFSGTYELLANNRISFGQSMATKMYCEGAMTVEDQLFKILEKVDSYEVIGDNLSLSDNEGNIIAKFEAVYF